MGGMQLAFRNVIRHRRRSGIALIAICFGVVALVLSGGFIEWIFGAMRESVIKSRLGHIQVAMPGYRESGAADPFAYLLPGRSADLSFLQAMPGVKVIAPRLAFNGLISHGETSISFIGEGVDPGKEGVLSQFVFISRGENLSDSDPNGIILGEGLAANLGVNPGDTVVLLANTRSGGVNAVETRVRGLFHTATKAYDDAALRTPIELSRKLLRVTGTHHWAVLLDETKHTDAALRHMQTDHRLSKLQFIPWFELADFYNKTVALFSTQIDVVRLIIALIIVLSISNTMVMSVLERTGEVGTMMAMGSKRANILVQFLQEGLVLGVIGGALGLIIGALLASVISAIGIPMPPAPGMRHGFTGGVSLTVPLVLNAFLLALLTTLLATIYPAFKASRLNIVDALRYNR